MTRTTQCPNCNTTYDIKEIPGEDFNLKSAQNDEYANANDLYIEWYLSRDVKKLEK